ncbi:tannase/feruloyl esterase family alpha/beta hydrolase [Agrobacterium rhizogenes]|uniref:tannase/feruloyl esterase family alpha/beta hydrolase n=1 Tax=Rhizobium rhizogenes TaxID=359 RepID=UPI0015741B64|nr:tannase/feruloyl esterase family alpha/beta hydrolase [Rhizobium rhizogenes]NTF52776.1 tannase/feruloyl esterase family alpha/beta hydrolase [Rhizobium rhizogenes]NTF65986.1 tannase/feruloyl esterase family alpha/beta hydrolase [Rhizobium rhizogenes]NTG18502.1 tannase/feruloyl esterase family alpha/beta hydrolase [Rhizobium rhizogenes]NTG97371.1 tannase/feruloyl esterase family alpha/beta hydrolase [Rhizobium rhizogenes]NTH09986.1 tannase/feruloyl esterase family alpha/beta hydrolase [Rhizo
MKMFFKSNYHRLPIWVVGILLIGLASTVGTVAARSETRLAVARTTDGLACDDGLKTSFRPDALTTVLLVKAFYKGDPLLLSGSPAERTPKAANDLCLVKLNIGPGNPGPQGAPSTSSGIGIEIWLPTSTNWNGRIHVMGGGGWAGRTQASLTELALDSAGVPGSPAEAAGVEGAVTATTDTGHSFALKGVENPAGGNGSFGMLPDGRINTVLWHDFSERAIHEMAIKTKALTLAFYGQGARYSYWDGFSTGGRQGLKEAQINPQDFDGILVGAPAINWTRFITSDLNPQVIMQRDLGGAKLSKAELDAVSIAAIRSCDKVGSVHLGYILDPAECRYDPTTDRSVLCASEGGQGVPGKCVTRPEAMAFNKIWYGQTPDGTAPLPALDNGFGSQLSGQQQWFGLARGTNLNLLAGPTPFAVSSDLVAMELGDPTLATPAFINARGIGSDRWEDISFARLKTAQDDGIALQHTFANINTDSADLSAFRTRGGKILMYHGLSDFLIPPQGSMNYYNRVVEQMGGLDAVQSFYRLYLIPGMAHAILNGTANPDAAPPLPQHDELYALLTSWVEKSQAPGRYKVSNNRAGDLRTFPLCIYPQRPVLVGKEPLRAESYRCS